MRAASATILAAAVFLAAPSASAQVSVIRFNRPGSGARAAGMANAFIAVSDDGTAASWNPAGLGQLRKPELSLVSTTPSQTIEASGFRTRDDLAVYSPVSTSYGSSYLDFASLAVPVTAFGKPLTFQASWRRLYALGYRESVALSREPLEPSGPPAAQIHSSSDTVGSIDLLSLAGAVKITPRLALGLSVNLWRGDWREEIWTSEATLEGDDPSRFRRVREDNRVRGNNASVGLLLTYPRWSLGLVYQSPLRSDYETTAGGETSDAPPVPELHVDGTIDLPRPWDWAGRGGLHRASCSPSTSPGTTGRAPCSTRR